MKELVKSIDYGPFIEEYLAQKDIVEKSRKTYRNALQQFFSWCTNRGLQQLAKKDILDYKKELLDDGKSAYTVSLYLTAVRCFLSWAEEEGVHRNVARNVKGAKIQTRVFNKDSLTQQQAGDLLAGIENQRDRAIILLMLGTALRCIEVSRADVKDICKRGDSMALMIQRKGHDSKDEYVKLKHPVWVEISKYLTQGEVRSSGPLFTSEARNQRGHRLHPASISRLVKEAMLAVNINSSRLSAHSLRHTSITGVLLAGGSLEEAQLLGGHASITTTMKYSHHIQREKADPEGKTLEWLKPIEATA